LFLDTCIITEHGFLTPVQKHEVDSGHCLIWICFINLFFLRWRRLKSKLQFLNHILNKGEWLYLTDICLAKLYFPILICSMCSKHMYYKLCNLVDSKWKTKWLKYIPKLMCAHTHTHTSDLIRSKPDEIVCAFGYVSNIMLFWKVLLNKETTVINF